MRNYVASFIGKILSEIACKKRQAASLNSNAARYKKRKLIIERGTLIST